MSQQLSRRVPEKRSFSVITHIRMPADLLDDILVEVSSITHHRTTHIESVFHTEVGGISEAKERTLLQLSPDLGVVDVLHPAVMSRNRIGSNMLLEDNNIVIRDFLGVHGRENGSSSMVDRVNHDGGGRCQQREQGKAEEALHDGKWPERRISKRR